MQSGASDEGAPSQQQSFTRLHRRLQRLQDERIHLEGVLAHERSLLAQQRSDNTQLRSQLAAQSLQQAETVELHCLQTAHASLHMGVALHHQADGLHAPEGQQHVPSTARDRFDAGLKGEKCQHGAESIRGSAGGQQLEHQLLQFQAELAMIDSERAALSMQLTAQQAQHDSERAVLHAAFSAEREDSLHVRQQLDMLSHGRLDDSNWQAHAVQLQAQHAHVVSELQEQCKAYSKQVHVHGSMVVLATIVCCSSKMCNGSQALIGKKSSVNLPSSGIVTLSAASLLSKCHCIGQVYCHSCCLPMHSLMHCCTHQVVCRDQQRLS